MYFSSAGISNTGVTSTKNNTDYTEGTLGGAVGRGTALQAGRSRFGFPIM